MGSPFDSKQLVWVQVKIFGNDRDIKKMLKFLLNSKSKKGYNYVKNEGYLPYWYGFPFWQ